MPTTTTRESLRIAEADMDRPQALSLAGWQVVVYSRSHPNHDGPNEDSALAAEVDSRRAVVAVADGAGGEQAGERASRLAIECLANALDAVGGGEASLREAILAGIDAANQRIRSLRLGASTTLAAASIEDGVVRTYHTGDSLALVVGQRGRRKLQTVSHSPVGYAVEAGLIDERDALHHEDLHVVSNMVGEAVLSVQVSGPLRLAPRDTLLLATDGLTDNVALDEIVETIRKGPLERAARRLAEAAAARMLAPREGHPSKPDDLTLVLVRSGSSRAGRTDPRRRAAGA